MYRKVIWVAQIAALISTGVMILIILAHRIGDRIDDLPDPGILTLAKGFVVGWVELFFVFLAVIPLYQALSRYRANRRGRPGSYSS